MTIKFVRSSGLLAPPPPPRVQRRDQARAPDAPERRRRRERDPQRSSHRDELGVVSERCSCSLAPPLRFRGWAASLALLRFFEALSRFKL